MHVALGDLDSTALADNPLPPTPKSGMLCSNLAAATDVEAALKRASERISRAIAEGFVLDPGMKPHTDDDGPDSRIDLVRPLLQSLVRRHENLQTILTSLAEVDPVGQQTERFITLLEEAIDDVEQALADGNTKTVLPQTDPRPDEAPPSRRDYPPVVSLIAGPDLDPASLFTPCARVNLRPAAYIPPAPAIVPEPFIAPGARPKRRPAMLAVLAVGLCIGPFAQMGPDMRDIAAPPADAQADNPRQAPRPSGPAESDAAGRPVEPPLPLTAPQTSPGPAPALRPAQEPALGQPQPADPDQPPQDNAATDTSTPGVPLGVPLGAPSVDPATADLYAARGDEKLAQKDISAARKFYEFAAGAGSARAALALARTYDLAFLAQFGTIGPTADALRAAMWYRRAALLGASGAIAEASSTTAKTRLTPAQTDARKRAP